MGCLYVAASLLQDKCIVVVIFFSAKSQFAHNPNCKKHRAGIPRVTRRFTLEARTRA
jgi:hypothetical protein